MIRKTKYALALAGLVALTTGAAFADDQALIDYDRKRGLEKPGSGTGSEQSAQAGALD